MAENGFSPILTSGCFHTDSNAVRRPQRRGHQRQREPSLANEPKEFPLYERSGSGGDVRRMLTDCGGCAQRFETTVTSIDGEWSVDQYDENHDGPHIGQPMKYDVYEANGQYRSSPGSVAPVVRLKVAHQEPISIRPRNKNPQIVNVCQTFRFPDNFITQNNANRIVNQERLLQQPLPVPESRRAPLSELPPCHSDSRSRLGGFFGAYRRHRNMFSQTSRTLIELVEAEQKQQQQSGGLAVAPRKMLHCNQDYIADSSESELSFGEPNDVRPRPTERKSKMPRIVNGRITHVRYFDRSKRNLVDRDATMGGHHGRSSKLPAGGTGFGRSSRHHAKPKPDHHRALEEDLVESPFVDEPFAAGTGAGRARKQHLAEEVDSIDKLDRLDVEADETDDDQIEGREEDDCLEADDLNDGIDEEEHEEETSEETYDRRRALASAADTGRSVVTKEGSFGVSGIVDKLQDNVWEVCLEGIWDLMDMAGRIDWKTQEKYITIINRKLIEFLKSPRTALCRSACQVSGELFRQAKSTKRPEFDEIVDILLCKTADPNRFIQKDANVALDKLVTYIPTPHTVRALSNRGTIHRNPLVRTATARLLVCVCVVAGLDAILGTTANTRTRKTILSMLAKFLTDKNLETRKFGERLYRMLRKHKFFDEYFYKDMDSNLRTNLKRVLKGV
uniref:CLASP_N domain-containing protein n=1 Tax=Anopheles dirus TaxID=7168 RepID=A0A182N5I5_9DIPT